MERSRCHKPWIKLWVSWPKALLVLAAANAVAAEGPSWALFSGYARPGIDDSDAEAAQAAAADPDPPSRLMRRVQADSGQRRSVSVESHAAFVDIDEREKSATIADSVDGSPNDTSGLLPVQNDSQPGLAALNQSKLFIVMTGDRAVGALKARSSWIQHLKWPDKALFACGAHCREDPRLESVVLVPDLLKPKKYTQRWDYRQAAMRAPWTIQWAWKLIQRTGSGSSGSLAQGAAPASPEKTSERDGYGFRLAVQPFKWWIVGDDDTFVNLPVLDKFLSRYDPEKPYVFAQQKANGGPGIVISKAAVEKFVPTFWTDYLPRYRNVTDDMWGDGILISAMSRGGAEVSDPLIMSQVGPRNRTHLCSGQYRNTFATWHHAWEYMQPEDYESCILNGTDSSPDV